MKGIRKVVIGVSALTRFIRYLYHWNLQFI